jgi:hypothetical protein
MPGLFERLQAELGDDDQSGVTPLEIADLPDSQRRILLWMLRDRATAADGIGATTLYERMPDAPDDCLKVISALARSGWVIALGEAPNVRYKVNLRRKRGSASGFGLWSVLNDRLSDTDAAL